MYEDYLTNKSTVTTATSANKVMLLVDGLLKWISISNLSTVMSSLITASQSLLVREVSASSDTVTAADRIITADGASNAVNLNVDPVIRYDSTNTTSPPLIVNRKNGSANDITITPTSGTINGASSLTFSSGAKTVYSDGSNLHAY